MRKLLIKKIITVTKKTRKRNVKNNDNDDSSPKVIRNDEVEEYFVINKNEGKLKIQKDIVGYAYIPSKRTGKNWCKAICTLLTPEYLATAVLSEYLNHILVQSNTDEEDVGVLEIYSHFGARLVEYFLFIMFNKIKRINKIDYSDNSLSIRKFKVDFKRDSNLGIPSILAILGGYLLHSLKTVNLMSEEVVDVFDEEYGVYKSRQVLRIPKDVQNIFFKDSLLELVFLINYL